MSFMEARWQKINHNYQKLTSKEMDITIEVGYSKSSLKNKELAHALFELAIDELLK